MPDRWAFAIVVVSSITYAVLAIARRVASATNGKPTRARRVFHAHRLSPWERTHRRSE